MTNVRVEIARIRNMTDGRRYAETAWVGLRGHVNWITRVLNSRLINSMSINCNWYEKYVCKYVNICKYDSKEIFIKKADNFPIYMSKTNRIYNIEYFAIFSFCVILIIYFILIREKARDEFIKQTIITLHYKSSCNIRSLI